MIQPMAVGSERMYCGSRPVRDPKYLRFIRRQASVVSGFGGCDPCHTGPHAYSQKASDLDVIPLTRKEHEQFDKNQSAYAELHGLDIPALIREFNDTYFGEMEKRA